MVIECHEWLFKVLWMNKWNFRTSGNMGSIENIGNLGKTRIIWNKGKIGEIGEILKIRKKEEYAKKRENKLGLHWAKLSSSWD